ncbi:ROK family protein [Naasia sp. SYSU D00948]|uniref:ROK family protein n=1 Tax=Naasia sp. SYSU D00948 TaxID=2817379 RepID=UPI001FED340B|nr:ROK family protein [Naasia sp. SYSU D00948]
MAPDGEDAPGIRLGLDIGGTKTEAVVLDAAGAVVGRLRVPTRPGADGVLASAEEAVSTMIGALADPPSGALTLGIGIPGSVDARTGRVANAVNLGVRDLALGRELTGRLGLAARVENDATAAAWGAFRTIAARRPELTSLACLNVGTGLAAGLVLAGRPWRGARGSAGEVGHLALDPAGEQCPCGQRGCLETVASGSGIARRWGRPASGLADAVLAGQPGAIRVWRDAVRGLATAVRVLVETLDVELVVLAGGVAVQGDLLLTDVRRELGEAAASSPFLASLDLGDRLAVLEPDLPVAAIGAALLAAEEAA